MKQILQNLSSGETVLESVPCPQTCVGHVLIRTSKSLVSAGTERMLVDFGKANLIDKARQQPDKVKEVLTKVKTEGLSATIEAVRSKLDQPLPLGYCNVGRVLDASDTGFDVGERVVSNGHHAEVVRVPKNLVVRIPDEVEDEAAAFTVVGAIALQGIRLVNPTLGETVVVTGLGLIGLMAVQILKANGCRVLGIDYDTAKCELARRFGADVVDLSKDGNAVATASSFSRGEGVDAVLITASAKTNDIMHEAAVMCRKRGRIILVGVVGLELRRSDFYEKELTFQVSCSYGPGRYDKGYEEDGADYPLPFIRWTENRNFEAVLDLMARGAIDVGPLISHRFDFNSAPGAYETLSDRSALGILLDYPETEPVQLRAQSVALAPDVSVDKVAAVNVAFVGAGNYASRILIPSFRAAGAGLESIVTSGGVGSVHHGRKNGFHIASTDFASALSDTVNTVVIATRHNMHAEQVIAALDAGKHVFVEKPLALTKEELEAIRTAYDAVGGRKLLMVGFNRRFSPHIVKMQELLSQMPAPKCFIMTMNAGAIPASHWTQDQTIGGGRIVGEACHYVDLMRYLAGAKITSFNAVKMIDSSGTTISDDKAIITLTFENGSIGTIQYFANGSKDFPKERIEAFCDGTILQLDNFRKLIGYGFKGFKSMKTWSQDKGQSVCVRRFVDAIKGEGNCPIPVNELFEVSQVSIEIAELLR